MPILERQRQRVFYEVSGSGPAVVLGHSLLCSGEMWEGQVPTLVFVGEEDRAQPVPRSEEIVHGISGSRLEIIPGAGHLSSLEQPELVTRAVLDFLAGLDLTEH